MEKEVRAIRFSISLNEELPEEAVYVTPEALNKEFEDNLDLMKNAYFNKDKINQLKKELCERIMKEDNPFSIHIVELDMYSIFDEDKIWK